jgi:cytoskeletal protein CcmA (bactofilin family)
LFFYLAGMIRMPNKSQRTDAVQDRAINRIVEGTTFRGTIESEGSFRVDGSFEGDLHIQGRLVIGAQGSVMGVVRCGQCEVEGRLEGDVTIQELLALKSTSRVQGELKYGQLSVEAGSQVSGVMQLMSKVKEMGGERLGHKSASAPVTERATSDAI